MKEVFIASARRTAIGGLNGSLSGLSAPELGGAAISAALEDSGVEYNAVSEVIMGCVLPAGLGQAPARQAGFHAGLGKSIPATTINKMCGSGMKAVMLGHDQIKAGEADIVIAGGMESMSNAPYLTSKLREGARLGHSKMSDHMFLDGLEDAYDKGVLMGRFAEDCAQHYQFSRTQQDDFALQSLARAHHAQQSGIFTAEITPVETRHKKQIEHIDIDEQPLSARPEKIPHLKPAFMTDGTVTPANSSSISDGAAALVLAEANQIDSHNLPVRARIAGHAVFAHEPGWFTTAPVHAAKKLMAKIGWQKDEVDLWEVNEAFAVVAMAFITELGLAPEQVNIHGGACALGHPIGASGARIIVSLLNAMDTKQASRGIAAICLGGGEGIAIALERA
ncbi:MAG: thiolase family protein [Candidatus Puniceispirillaceae bacterium]|jgi:acetyl-CoA C-acetyltransferase